MTYNGTTCAICGCKPLSALGCYEGWMCTKCTEYGSKITDMANTSTNKSFSVWYKGKKLECPFEIENVTFKLGNLIHDIEVLDIAESKDGCIVLKVFGYVWIDSEMLDYPDSDRPTVVYDDEPELCKHTVGECICCNRKMFSYKNSMGLTINECAQCCFERS